MGISDKTRKLLWGKSGNRCTICKCELTADSESVTFTSIIGAECHIRSSKPNGPRYDKQYPTKCVDKYENLVLLCFKHHKIVDDQANEYSVDSLLKLKKQHEAWVTEQLSPTKEQSPVRLIRNKNNIPSYLRRITSGTQLASMMTPYATERILYDGFSRGELELVSDFCQSIHDASDIYDELSVSEQFDIGFMLDDCIKKLHSNNIWVFVENENCTLTGGIGGNQNFPILVLMITKSDDPSIVSVPSV